MMRCAKWKTFSTNLIPRAFSQPTIFSPRTRFDFAFRNEEGATVARHLEIKLNPMGLGTCEIDGIPISKYTNGIELESYVGEPAKVRLSLAPGVSLDLAVAVGKFDLEGDCPNCGHRITVTGK
jgi:hypothetical protein